MQRDQCGYEVTGASPDAIEATIRAGNRTLAHALDSERLARKQDSGYNRRQFARTRSTPREVEAWPARQLSA